MGTAPAASRIIRLSTRSAIPALLVYTMPMRTLSGRSAWLSVPRISSRTAAATTCGPPGRTGRTVIARSKFGAARGLGARAGPWRHAAESRRVYGSRRGMCRKNVLAAFRWCIGRPVRYKAAMTETITATDAVLDRITRAIVERFHPESILLFGSRARGDTHAYSDYDIMVVMHADPAVADPATAIRALFRDAPWNMDVLVWTPEEFERKRDDVGTLVYVAAREGRVLYARDGAIGAAHLAVPAPRVREERHGLPESLADWMHRAQNDFRSVEQLAGHTSPVWDTVCSLAHAGAEKYLKSLLVATHTPPPRTH